MNPQELDIDYGFCHDLDRLVSGMYDMPELSPELGDVCEEYEQDFLMATAHDDLPFDDIAAPEPTPEPQPVEPCEQGEPVAPLDAPVLSIAPPPTKDKTPIDKKPRHRARRPRVSTETAETASSEMSSSSQMTVTTTSSTTTTSTATKKRVSRKTPRPAELEVAVEPEPETTKKQNSSKAMVPDLMYRLPESKNNISRSETYYGRVLSITDKGDTDITKYLHHHAELLDTLKLNGVTNPGVYYVSSQRAGDWIDHFNTHMQKTGNYMTIYWSERGRIAWTARCTAIKVLPKAGRYNGYPISAYIDPNSEHYQKSFADRIPASVYTTRLDHEVSFAYFLTDISIVVSPISIRDMDFVELSLSSKRKPTGVGMCDWVGPVISMKRCGYINVVTGVKNDDDTQGDLSFTNLTNEYSHDMISYNSK